MVDPGSHANHPCSEDLLADLEARLRRAKARFGREMSATLAEGQLTAESDRGGYEPAEQGAAEYAQSIDVELLQQDADTEWQVEDALERIVGRRTLPALREYLPPTEAAHLAAQMPALWRGVFYEGWRPGAGARPERDRAGFLGLIRRGLRFPPHDPEAMARAVFHALAERIAPGEIEDVKRALPRQVRESWSRA